MEMFVLNVVAVVEDPVVAEVGGLVGVGGDRLGCYGEQGEQGEQGGHEGERVGQHF